MAVEDVLRRYIENLGEVYGQHLKKVILYGSYARGDFHEDSDIDIMILVDMEREAIEKKRRRLSEVTYDFCFDHDVDIMPIVQNQDFFEKWVGAYPFYNNVNNEGGELYAA